MTTHLRLGGFGTINTAPFNAIANRARYSTGYVDSPGFPPLQTTGSGGGGVVIPPPVTRGSLFTNQVNQTHSSQSSDGGITTNPNGGGGMIVDYGCPDGSRVSDPSMCPTPIVTTGGGGGVDPSGGGYTDPEPVPGGDPGIIAPDQAPVTQVVVGLSPIGKFMLAGLGILAGIAGAAAVIHHHNSNEPR